MTRQIFLSMMLLSVLVLPRVASASTTDLTINTSDITFSSSQLYAGDTARVYARVRNVGDTDVTAFVTFFAGSIIIGTSQAVSVKAGGDPDEVFVDFTVPSGLFNIRAVIQQTSPQDSNPANDASQSPLYTPIRDADKDGALDDSDSCVDVASADQLDSDKDGIGDACDPDIDNDKVLNDDDKYPLDATKSADPKPVVVKAPSSPKAASAPVVVALVVVAPVEAPSNSPIPLHKVSGNTVAGGEPTLSLAASSKLTTSPLARFTWKQIDWRTYEFTLAQQPTDGVRFSWDFGDGATSVQPQITHAFSGPGTYIVTITIFDADGKVLSDAQTFDVTFFHLDNPKVIGLMVLLVIALGALGFTYYKIRQSYWRREI